MNSFARLNTRLRWSQVKLAAVFGVTQPTISRWLKAETDDEMPLLAREKVQELLTATGPLASWQTLGLNEWRDRIHVLACEKGGWPTTSATHGAVHVALVHGEVSEVMEELRKPVLDEAHLAEEVADAIGRLLDIAGAYNLDVETAMREKHEKNKTRPHLHGKKF